MTSTQQEIAEKLSEAFLTPVREIGLLLATEIDKTNQRLEMHSDAIAELAARVRKLEETNP